MAHQPNTMKSIAIITARGGSKRIPGKNIRNFLGKPILAYSIETALKSGIFDEVMVSTDSQEIAEVSKKYGANIPFMRSKKNSSDTATTGQALFEVIEFYKNMGQIYEYGCCIYPTAPFITPARLIEAYSMIQRPNTNVVIPIVKFPSPVMWALEKNNDNEIRFRWPENEFKRSQELDELYYDAGQFYFFNIDKFLLTNSLYTSTSVGLTISENEVQDIDTDHDWQMAEMKYVLLNNNNGV